MTRIAIAVVLAVLSMSSISAQDAFLSAGEIRPLLPGSTIPDATVQQEDGSTFALSGRGRPIVLIFYRGGW